MRATLGVLLGVSLAMMSACATAPDGVVAQAGEAEGQQETLGRGVCAASYDRVTGSRIRQQCPRHAQIQSARALEDQIRHSHFVCQAGDTNCR